MIPAFLLLALGQPMLLSDEIHTIPASDWRYVEVALRQQTATVDCAFKVLTPGSGVRLLLVTVPELNRFRHGQSHDVLATTNFEREGRLRYTVRDRGDFAVVVDNRMEGRGPARVSLRIELEFSGGSAVQARTLSPRRRHTVIAISLAVFLITAVWAGRRLLAALPPRGSEDGPRYYL
jgi:hypothetical protein